MQNQEEHLSYALHPPSTGIVAEIAAATKGREEEDIIEVKKQFTIQEHKVDKDHN